MVGAARFAVRLSLGSLVAAVVPAHAQPTESPTTVALRFFEALPTGEIRAVLRALRPPVMTADERALVLATLPREGELAPDPAERRKIVALHPVLVSDERDLLSDIKVIDLPQAALVIYNHAVLLVSRPAVRLLSPAELQAAVAHEIGHEYFSSEYERTGRTLGAVGRQTLELKCDGVAALTLLALGLDVSPLISGMRKVVKFNEALGLTTDDTGYPTVREREHFVRALLKMTAARRE